MTDRNYADEPYPERKTLRDEFAMAALTGLLVHVREDAAITAAAAYSLADAMLAERRKG